MSMHKRSAFKKRDISGESCKFYRFVYLEDMVLAGCLIVVAKVRPAESTDGGDEGGLKLQFFGQIGYLSHDLSTTVKSGQNAAALTAILDKQFFSVPQSSFEEMAHKGSAA
jgi:hypothetical protein